ncbi:MAG TPA: type II toxin-antitoxin system VapC family toxin [Gaiellaceae bacterium]|nr:type II toxin-antitoxin system VapC family toxin [Gaiellaceae bacterium]
MLLLLDTHAFLWWNADDRALGSRAREAIADPDNVVYVSAATAWEIAVKRRAGKLEAPGEIADWIRDDGFSDLAIEVEHAIASAELPEHHRDPFDRLLIAQARLEDLTLVTSDVEIVRYDVETLDASS